MIGRRSKIRSMNPRTVKNKPLWYVFVDESGWAYCRNGEPFVMSAVVGDDPELIASIALRQESDTASSRIEPGKGELKFYRSNYAVRTRTMEEIGQSGAYLFSIVHSMQPQADHPKEYETATYLSMLSRLFIKIEREGPAGYYKIRVDNSRNYIPDLVTKIAQDAFAGSSDKALTFSGIAPADSEITPAIQTADMFAGAHRQAIMNNRRDAFEREYGVSSWNKRREGPPCGRVASIREDSRVRRYALATKGAEAEGWALSPDLITGGAFRTQTYRFPSASENNIGQHV